MIASPIFRFLKGDHSSRDLGTSNVNLSTGNSNVGTLPTGTALGQHSNPLEGILANNATFLGIIQQPMDELGYTSAAAQLILLQGWSNVVQNIPVKKGERIAIRVPGVGAEAEVEGAGGTDIGNLLATTGGRGLAADQAANTPLTFTNGCLCQATTDGDMVYAHLVRMMTPLDDANRRAHIRYCSPYKLVVPV